MRSAVSCSVPLVFRPYTLMAKDPLTGQPVPWNDLHKQYIDGSVDGDLPMTRLSEMFNVNHFIVSQVNPHVVPFLPREDGPSNTPEQWSSYVPNWLSGLTHLAKDEVLHRMSFLSELGVFPTSMTKFASIMNQKYSGDINIYPELISSNFPRILENPTTEFMLESCLGGERATWPKLSRIRNACAIELALDRAIRQMRARVTFHPGQLELRMYDTARHSIESSGSIAGRGRIGSHRRSSHSHELVRRRSRGSSQSAPFQKLRKARSTVSLEHPSYKLSNEPVCTKVRPRAHTRRSSITFGGVFEIGSGSDVFEIGSGSDDEEETDLADSMRPRSTRRNTSWDGSGYNKDPNHSLRTTVRSRRSSVSSGKSQRGATDQRASKQGQPLSAREVSMALSPSSRPMLSMTPSSPDSSKRKRRL